MRKKHSIRGLPGGIPYSGPPVSIKEMDESIGDYLMSDDLRIRRQWRTLGPQRPLPVPGETEALHQRAHEAWHAGNHRSAFRLMQAAAKRGSDSAAMSNLGYFYDVGIGVKKNRTSAMKWYGKAYKKGNAGAANNIGTVYRAEGKSKRAIYWFTRAVEMGEIDSNLEIARVFLEDLNIPIAAIPYLRRVLDAKPAIEVTESSREEASLLLKPLERRRTRNKRRT
jgi:uncharacterized protein